MNTTTEIQGLLFDGRTPAGRAATLFLRDSRARLTISEGQPNGEREYERAALRVSPRIARADRFLRLPDGRQLQCKDAPALDDLPQDEPSEGFLSWLERRTWVALLAIVATLAGAWSFHRYAIPELAERAAAEISVERERAFGAETLEQLDTLFLDGTRLSSARQSRLRERFLGMTAGLSQAKFYRLEFRSSPLLNAYALPGGTIVVTDKLVEKCESDEQVLAILAHEAGHVERRHTLRQMLQDSADALLAFTILGDASGIAVGLAHAEYSSALEAEADAFAFDLLARRGLSPALFAEALERIAPKHRTRSSRWDFTATHPATADRIARARAAGRSAGATLR